MTKTDASANLSRFIMLASLCMVLAALYFGRDVLIPLALAALLSFLLAPVARFLQKLHLPRSVAVTVSVLLAFALLVGIGWIVFNQVADLKSELPTYQRNIQSKIDSVRGPGGIVSRFRSAGVEVKKALGNGPTTEPADAMPVRLVNNDSASQDSPFGFIKPVGSFLLGPLGTAFVVTVFAIFMLLQHEDIRDRLIRLLGRNQLTLTTQALDDAAARVSRYLIMQTIVNGSVGLLVTIVLWAIGKMNGQPFPGVALWGLMTALLRFIPYVGIWISSVMPILLATAVYQKYRVPFEVFMSYGTIETIAANFLEPMLYGSSTGIATLAVLVAAAFWTWLWGPVGLLLSTPLTVCLVVMGKYVPQLEFLTILLAEEPALGPPDRLYQRLLAADHEAALELAREYFKKMPLEVLYTSVLVPALTSVDRDAQINNLSKDQQANIRQGMRKIIADLGEKARIADAKANDKSVGEKRLGEVKHTRICLPKGCKVSIVLLPASDESDEISALMLAQLLELRGYCAVVVSPTQLVSEMVQIVKNSDADVVCISAMPPAAITHARYLCKRLQAPFPELEMLVGIWTSAIDIQSAKARIATGHPIQVATEFSQALELMHQLALPKITNTAPAA